ncbi:MAG TPA: SDR family NAD(P)-dependent oxidoreductase, partial [Acidobacteriota bacterium]|nr:SDR family NAD(P)-dependent oxidoreductase [Acidobacteriota bacterium]
MNPQRFHGKVALITGASSGIGRTTAVAFAREGATVVLADLDEENGHSAVRSIEELGAKALFLRADVTSAADAQSLVRGIVDAFGRLDFAYNNAAIAVADSSEMRETADFEEETWDRIIDVNLKGVWLCMKYELR